MSRLRVVDAHGNTRVPTYDAEVAAGPWTTPQVFERGDKLYLTAPLQVFEPSPEQIEEFAFAQQLKTQAPNDHIMWLRGQYVEADNANMNGAQWRAGELALKQLTPMLMPITVMHDPRTAVGTIADVSLLTPEKDNIPRARLDTYLALWSHRFPEVADEAKYNAERGTLMQSMECFSPWYECSECGMAFQKLPRGAERASWCEHLRASDPSAGFTASSAQTSNASRILGDVCFTGTGLIFGTRGAVGAYTEAHLEVFQEEVAAHLQELHSETAPGRTHNMALVQIEETELAVLRKERDDSKAAETAAKTEAAEKQTALEAAEAAKAAAEKTAKDEKERADKLDQEKASSALSKTRLDSLGAGFKAKIDAIPSVKAALEVQAGTMKDEEWEARLVEIEGLASVKRDAAADGSTTETPDAATAAAQAAAAAQGQTFTPEELARFQPNQGTPPGGAGQVTDVERASTVGKLAGIFGPPKPNGDKAKA